MAFEINNITGKEILDSRGNPTLEVVVTAGGESASFQVPSGASTGVHEAHELRDDATSRGGMKRAINQLESVIMPALIGFDVLNQRGIDELMLKIDGTKNKGILGGNTMLGVSIASAKVAAILSGKELYEYLRTLCEMKPSRTYPYLYANLINGGKHASNGLAFQEYHVVPQGENLPESLVILGAVQEELKKLVTEKFGKNITLGDEGGFDIPSTLIEEPLELLETASKKAGFGNKVRFALDVAASSFYNEASKTYRVDGNDIREDELMARYGELIARYNLLSIEDPFHEEAFEAFRMLKEAHPDSIVVGDDLTVTNVKRLEMAIEKKSVSALIIKPNQIGTLTETLETMALARKHGIECIVSHRSGETMDDFIADLAIAFSCFGIKAGARGPKEREAKYSRLQKILS
ncbi:MAG: Enolase [Patescibacteria group bacterium]|nr:Enolase [Patescibacteria group bacterium]